MPTDVDVFLTAESIPSLSDSARLRGSPASRTTVLQLSLGMSADWNSLSTTRKGP